MTTNLPIYVRSTIFINCMKVLCALDNSNGITIHSYSLSLVLKEIFYSCPSWIFIWWYQLLKLILLKYLSPYSTSIMSSKRGIGNRYLMVILFICFLSMHILHVLSCFGVNNVGTTQGLMLSLTTPFFISSVTYQLSSACCVVLWLIIILPWPP